VPDLSLFVEPLRGWALLAAGLALPMLLLAAVVYRRYGALFPPPLPPAPEAPPWPPTAVSAEAVQPQPAEAFSAEAGPARPLEPRPMPTITFEQPLHGGEVLAGFLLSTFIVALVALILQDTGALHYLAGAAPDKETQQLRHGLWSATLALPFQVAGIFLLLRRTWPAQLGWTTQRTGQNVLVGFLYWLLLMPGVLWFNLLVGRWYERLSASEPEQHAIQRLVESTATRPDWLLAVLTALVAAPLIEELLYRGLLQSWLTGEGRRGDIIVTLALALAIFIRGEDLLRSIQAQDVGQLQLELQPAAFVLALLPIYLTLRWRGLTVASGIFAGALFFAMVHSGVWPSPVPLLPLGLTLGYLAWRTHSLVGPIVLHALFNSVALLGLLLHDPVANGNPVTSTSDRAPAVSTSTFVPGASWPRLR